MFTKARNRLATWIYMLPFRVWYRLPTFVQVFSCIYTTKDPTGKDLPR